MKNNNKVLIELDIESIAFQGLAVARLDNKVYFVKGALPGEKVIARLTKKKSRYNEAVVESIITPSKDRVEAVCPYFGTCGGCSWQHLSYEQQLFWKRQHVIDAFERIGKVSCNTFHPTLHSPKQFHYRNKMEFSFANSRWLTNEEISSETDIEQKEFALGLHVPGRYDKVLDITQCFIQPEIGNELLTIFRQKALELSISAYDARKHEGFLRNLVLRQSGSTGELMIVLVTNDLLSRNEESFINWFEHSLPLSLPPDSTLIHALNNTVTPVAVGSPRVVTGKGYITEKVHGVDFRISPFSFFQTNSFQLPGFIKGILDYAQLQPSDVVWDLYCGTGSISLTASQFCKEVYGVELVESAVDDARSNAKLNSLKNAEFFCADLHSKQIPELLRQIPQADVLIIDPPRAGMHKNLVEHILLSQPERMVYVSCNPASQARDLEMMAEKYSVEEVQPVDMFPHTFHVESIARLSRK